MSDEYSRAEFERDRLGQTGSDLAAASESDPLEELARHIAATGKFLMAYHRDLEVGAKIYGFDETNRVVKVIRKISWEEWQDWLPYHKRGICEGLKSTYWFYEVIPAK